MEYDNFHTHSKKLFEEAKKFLPGGVTYALRYFEPYPFYVVKAKGSKIWDIDGNEYIDFWMGHGAIITGHMYEPIIKALKEQLEYGFHFGWCNEWEIKWAKAVCKWFSTDMVRPTNSGTEANMYAIRLARAYTGKIKVGKFEGGWHGGYDSLHKSVNYPYDKPASLGLTEESIKNIVTLPYNDLEGVYKKVKKEELACIIVEPIMGAGGCIPAEKEFLKGLKELCEDKDALLIFDEVITGFRFFKGAQHFYNVKPDLTTLGKAVGGQYFPGAGAFCGKTEIMEKLNQIKNKNFWERVFHGGTYTGNALTMRMGYELITDLENKGVNFYNRIDKLGEEIRRELKNIFEERKVKAYVTGLGSLFAIHFTNKKPIDGLTAEITKNKDLTRKLFEFMINNGVAYLTPLTPHFFLSSAHTNEDKEKFLSLIEEFINRKT
ncbi:MAG: aspartate aminotransferase family protein [Candidatus Bathyarchaeia archaeon]